MYIIILIHRQEKHTKYQNTQRNNSIVQFKMTKRPDIIITSDDAAASKRQEIRRRSKK